MRPNFLEGLANKAVVSEKARLSEEAAANGENKGGVTPPESTGGGQQQQAPAVSEETKKEIETLSALFEKHNPGKKYSEITGFLGRKPLDEEIAEVFGKPRNEVDEFIKNPPKPTIEFKTPLLKQHHDFVEDGGTEEQWEEKLALKRNLATMSDESLVKLGLRLENEGANAEDIDTLFSSLYRIPKELDPTKYYEEEVEDRKQEIAAAKVRIKVAAQKIKAAELSKTVEALKAPVVRERQEVDPKIIEAGKQLRKTVFDKFEATKGIEIEVVDGEPGKETKAKLNFDLKPEQRALAQQILNSPTGFFEAMCSKDGALDPEKFVRMATLIAGGTEAIQTMALDLANAKLADFIKEMKNANFEITEGTPAGDAAKDAIKRATKQVFSRNK